MTFVNFTTTQSSLQNQCMNFLLKSERPDVDEKRKNMIKLQSELKVVFLGSGGQFQTSQADSKFSELDYYC